MKILLIYLGIINLTALLFFGIDKQRAKQKKWRISEKSLFLPCLLGGGIGAWIGMYFFRHKTKHWYFVLFIPLITLVEYAALIWGILQLR